MEVNVSLGQMVLAFVAAMGIPSAIMGLIIWRLERRIDKREKEQAAQEQGQKDLFVLIVQGTNAAIALGEATARAVQRIPDAHCNGDMHDALDYAADIKHKQKDFLTRARRFLLDGLRGTLWLVSMRGNAPRRAAVGVQKEARCVGRPYCHGHRRSFLRPRLPGQADRERCYHHHLYRLHRLSGELCGGIHHRKSQPKPPRAGR